MKGNDVGKSTIQLANSGYIKSTHFAPMFVRDNASGKQEELELRALHDNAAEHGLRRGEGRIGTIATTDD